MIAQIALWWATHQKALFKYVALVVGVIGIIGGLALLINGYGQSRYEAGVALERAKWESQMRRTIERVRTEEQRLAAQREARAVESAKRDAQRLLALNQVQTEITHAQTDQEAYAAYLRYRGELRARSADRHRDAVSHYLSTIGADADSGAGADQPGNSGSAALSDPTRTPELHGFVGSCFG